MHSEGHERTNDENEEDQHVSSHQSTAISIACSTGAFVEWGRVDRARDVVMDQGPLVTFDAYCDRDILALGLRVGDGLLRCLAVRVMGNQGDDLLTVRARPGDEYASAWGDEVLGVPRDIHCHDFRLSELDGGWAGDMRTLPGSNPVPTDPLIHFNRRLTVRPAAVRVVADRAPQVVIG